MATSLRILLVEDRNENIEAAKVQLAGHELTVVSGYDQAYNLLIPSPNESQVHEKLKSVALPEGCEISRVSLEKGYSHVEIKWSATGKIAFLNDSCPSEKREQLEEAYRQCRKAVDSSMEVPIDVVLTDVMFPKGGNECMNDRGNTLVHQQGEMPYGPVVALRALSVGVKRVGILTQGDHHSDPFVFAFDNLKGFQIGDVKVVCNNRMTTLVDAKSYQKVKEVGYSDEGRAAWEEQGRRCVAGELITVKDWATLLEQLIG